MNWSHGKRIAFFCIKALFVFYVSILLVSLFFSISTILTTVTLYVLVLYSGLSFIRYIENRRSENYIKYKLLLLSTVLSLVTVELSLRFVIKKNMSYSEQIAGLYVSPYLANKLAKFIGVNLQDDFSFVEKYRKNKSRIESFGDEFAYEHKFNSLGCRGAEPNIDSNNLRVLTLGDSFTEGVGAPVDSTWPHLLSKRIADFFDVGVSYLNGGTSGSDPFQNYYFLERNVDFFRPDLVVLVINHSDILDMYYRGNERFAGGKAMSYKWGPWWEPIYALSYIFRLAVQARGGMDMSFIRYDESFEVKLNSLNLISQVVKDKFNVLSEEKDFEFWIFFVPYQHDYLFDSKEFYFFDSIMSGNNVNYKGLKEDVRLYASSNGVTTQDLYWKKDMHPNSKGYYMLSKLIFDEILSNGRLGRRIDARKKLN